MLFLSPVSDPFCLSLSLSVSILLSSLPKTTLVLLTYTSGTAGRLYRLQLAFIVETEIRENKEPFGLRGVDVMLNKVVPHGPVLSCCPAVASSVDICRNH